MGNLLTRAGFALPGVDVDQYTVRYKSGVYLVFKNSSVLPILLMNYYSF